MYQGIFPKLEWVKYNQPELKMEDNKGSNLQTKIKLWMSKM